MSTILRFHYFITKDMRADLDRGGMGGTVPMLYVFLARMGCTVLDTTYVTSPAPGVKITFSTAGTPPDRLLLQDRSLGRQAASLLVRRARPRQQPAQSRHLPPAHRRLQRPQLPPREQPRHRAGRLRHPAARLYQRLDRRLLRPLRAARGNVRQILPARPRRGLRQQPAPPSSALPSGIIGRSERGLLMLADPRSARSSGSSQSSSGKQLLFLVSLALCAHAIASDPIADATAKFLAGLPVRGTALEGQSHDPSWARTPPSSIARGSVWRNSSSRRSAPGPPEHLGGVRGAGRCFTCSADQIFSTPTPFSRTPAPTSSAGLSQSAPCRNRRSRAPVLPSALANLRKSLDSVLSWSFFITKNMKVDLTQTQLNGTLPVLYVFLARAGCTIDSVALVALDRSGSFVPEAQARRRRENRFLRPERREQRSTTL